VACSHESYGISPDAHQPAALPASWWHGYTDTDTDTATDEDDDLTPDERLAVTARSWAERPCWMPRT
jgi:hypothetical protein